jgi:sugar lactone lactonase YvrE
MRAPILTAMCGVTAGKDFPQRRKGAKKLSASYGAKRHANRIAPSARDIVLGLLAPLRLCGKRVGAGTAHSIGCLVAATALAVAARADDAKLADARYPEGALWYDGRLYYAEMGRNVVVRSDLKTTDVFWRKKGCGPVSIAPYRGGFVVLCHLAHKVVRVSRAGKTIASIERDAEGKPFPYPNAAAADGASGVYFSSSGVFSLDEPATGAVLYLDAQGKLARVAEGIRYANGVAVDAARKRLLVSAHLARQVLTFPILAAGKLGEGRVFFDFAAHGIAHAYRLAGPDGLEIDSDGNVLVAEYGEGRIHKIAPDGALVGTVGSFAPYVTDTALLPGGRAAVTASRVNNAPPYPGEVVLSDRLAK